MNTLQLWTLQDISSALRKATEYGMFDTPEMLSVMHPDVINQFCDGIEEVLKQEREKRT